MSPSDLARWGISLINRSLLKPQSYDALYTSTKLKNGSDTNYSLGLVVWDNNGRLGLGHSGGGSGSSAENRACPLEKIAIVAFTNNDWASAAEVVSRVANVVLPPTTGEARARAVFDGFQKGTIDRVHFTNNANAFLTPAVLADQKTGLTPLRPVRTFSLQGEYERGGMPARNWKIVTANATLTAAELTYPNARSSSSLRQRQSEWRIRRQFAYCQIPGAKRISYRKSGILYAHRHRFRHIAEMTRISREHMHRSRKEDGCISHGVQIDAENPLRLTFFEQWSDAEALENHCAVPELRAFANRLRELSADPGEIAVYEAAKVRV